jgi:SAM-dependent methyltransferase
MQKRHFNRKDYFEEQGLIVESVVLPYITSAYPISAETLVLEIGCGEAGNLRPFLDRGCKVTGIDRSKIRIERAIGYFADHPKVPNLHLVASDIFDVDPVESGLFDLIIMRDSFEHIQNKEKLILHIARFLKPGGRIFVSFPPWRMPFGGHQQLCENRVVSKIPYFHLLPLLAYTFILKLFGENKYRIDELLEIRNTRLSISNFRDLVKYGKLKIEKEDFFLISPAYNVKFNIKVRKLPDFLNLPYCRDFFTTACYYLLS